MDGRYAQLEVCMYIGTGSEPEYYMNKLEITMNNGETLGWESASYAASYADGSTNLCKKHIAGASGSYSYIPNEWYMARKNS